MEISYSQAKNGPVAIAPAAPSPRTDPGVVFEPLQPAVTMPYTCQICSKRKVKCDKALPRCSTCRKGKQSCVYRAPSPRRRKRKLSGDIAERLARYEAILEQHGLLPVEDGGASSVHAATKEELPIRINELETSRHGKLLSSQGKSRYIDSNIWRNLGEDELENLSDHDEGNDEVTNGIPGGFASDPLTGAFIGSQMSLLHYHPSPVHAILLWKTHVTNVEPICKILHIPSTFKMVEMASQQPEVVSKADECLLFAIYHFAIFSMTDDQCVIEFGLSRFDLLQSYRFATQQALVNAQFLKSIEMPVLQALVLFLLAGRHFFDSHTYWILTGVAIRIGQRIGVHRDGEKLGLSPFEVQMRRRLYYQLIPLEGTASQMSGSGLQPIPETWDTQSPLNINDDQIWPGMVDKPIEQKGATEMMFCLVRSCVGKFFLRAGKLMHGAASGQFDNYNDFDAVADEAEKEVEEKYIRYCDVVNPLHFLAIALARSAITAMRLRSRLPQTRNKILTDSDRKELFTLAQKILDTDRATHAHATISRFRWHVESFFVWGSWDSLIFVLTSLRAPDLLSPEEKDAAWKTVEQMHSNHAELANSKQALLVALRRLTLKAYEANPPDYASGEPAFVTALRSARKDPGGSIDPQTCPQSTVVTCSDSALTHDLSESGTSSYLDTSTDGMEFDAANDFNMDDADWMFWSKLISDYQQQDSQNDKVAN